MISPSVQNVKWAATESSRLVHDTDLAKIEIEMSEWERIFPQ